MRVHRLFTLGSALVLPLTLAGAAHATPVALVNGDFQTGTLAGWTTFVTANGSLGPAPLPDVQSFDVNGDAVSTLAARFQVGEVTFTGLEAGGGLFQSFVSGAGTLSINADIASFNSDGANAAGGVFSLLLDGVVRNTFDFGDIGAGVTERSSLSASVAVAAGSHELRFLITRPFLNGGSVGATPFQFLDDVRLDLGSTAAVPEPATLTLLGVGIAGLAARRRRSKASS